MAATAVPTIVETIAASGRWDETYVDKPTPCKNPVMYGDRDLRYEMGECQDADVVRCAAARAEKHTADGTVEQRCVRHSYAHKLTRTHTLTQMHAHTQMHTHTQ